MRRRERREMQTMSLSFIDCICCAFGAIILLLVITKLFEPIRIDESRTELEELIVRYQQELEELLQDAEVVQRERDQVLDRVQSEEAVIAQLQRQLTRIRAEMLDRQDDAEIATELAGRLAQAKQSLTAEMEQLLADYRPPVEEYKIGGLPVDSEYIIFIVDTSGSMRNYAWDMVQRQMRETLDAYPTVRGIQIMNDQGEYLFKSYRNEWIPDTPGRRAAIIDAMRNWNAFSTSSPREGILAAIDTFYDPEKRVSLYVYSDDFASGSISAVVREVDRKNRANDPNGRRVRIHAVAFPVYYDVTGGELITAARLATLMRVLCQRNGGTFVALPSRRHF